MCADVGARAENTLPAGDGAQLLPPWQGRSPAAAPAAAMRPRRRLKNLRVAAASAAAGIPVRAEVPGRLAAGFAAFGHADGDEPRAGLSRRRRAEAVLLRRRRPAIVDAGAGVALVGIVLAPGLATLALATTITLAGCGPRLLAERMRARHRKAGRRR
jgi:hypothetical protein